jgi:hypothetical protein
MFPFTRTPKQDIIKSNSEQIFISNAQAQGSGRKIKRLVLCCTVSQRRRISSGDALSLRTELTLKMCTIGFAQNLRKSLHGVMANRNLGCEDISR